MPISVLASHFRHFAKLWPPARIFILATQRAARLNAVQPHLRASHKPREASRTASQKLHKLPHLKFSVMPSNLVAMLRPLP